MNESDPTQLVRQASLLLQRLDQLQGKIEPLDQEQIRTLGVGCHEQMLECAEQDPVTAISLALAGERLFRQLQQSAPEQPDWVEIFDEQFCRYGALWIHRQIRGDGSLNGQIQQYSRLVLRLLERLELFYPDLPPWIPMMRQEMQELAQPALQLPRLALVGNCQMHPIYLALRQVLPELEIYFCPSVHLATASDVAELHAVLPETDFLVMHRIQPGYRDGIGLDGVTLQQLLRPQARRLVLPNLHYEGHHPWIGYVHDPEGRLAQLEASSPLGPYHDFLAMAAARRGLSAQDLLTRNLPEECAGQIREHHQNSLEQLRQREVDCAVEISSWIDDHHRQLPIVHTINHPTHAALWELLLRVLASLSLKAEMDPTSVKVEEHLGELSIPILPWVRKALGLEAWAETWGHRHHDQPFGISAQLESSIAFYREHPWIAALNQHMEKAHFAESVLDQLLSHPVGAPFRSPSVAALINYFDDIDMLRWQVRGGFLGNYDRIYIWDGPYDYLASIPFFLQQPRRLDETELGRELLADPRVVYHYQEWKGEAEKRIAAYEAIKEDIVVLHDTDEFSIAEADQYERFWTSEYAVASNCVQNLYISGLYCTYDPEEAPALDSLPHKNIAFKRRQMSASDHLNYLWLVGVEQEPVAPSRIDPRHLAYTYHLTACRSPLGQEAKMSFYTALYFSDKPLSWVIEKLVELMQKGLLSESQARQIFLLGDPGYTGIPNPDFGLIVHHRIVDPSFPNDILDAMLAERNRVGFGNYLLLQGYPLCLWLEATVGEIVISLGLSARLTVCTWDWINGSHAQDRPTLTTESAVSRIQFSSQTSDLHGRLLKLVVEPDPSLPPLLAVKISDPEA